ncbi:MAG: hypothetical protein O2856_18700, partial [Planctomycetota bacterium]|nr:hypothetical protein [Planctomycetota bacterium]
MRRFHFTDDERNAIAKERFCHPNPRVQQRMEILWLKLHLVAQAAWRNPRADCRISGHVAADGATRL